MKESVDRNRSLNYMSYGVEITIGDGDDVD